MRVMISRCFCLVVMALMFLSHSESGLVRAADEWPQFRGPATNGHSDVTGLPLEWSEQKNVRWKTALPGEGHSSPVISGNQIWLTMAMTQTLTEEEQKTRLAKLANSNGLQVAGALRLQAVCVNRESGKIEQTIDLFKVDEPEPKHSLNSYASPTPIIDGQRVYFHFGTYGTAAVDAASGKVLWRNTEHHVDHQNGPGSSPALWRDRLIINFDGIDQQYVAAIDAETGRTLWTTKRSGEMDPKAEFQKAYCTPTVIEDERGIQVISPGANWVYSYDPESGRELWKAAYGMLGFSTVPRPVFGNGLVFVSTSFIRPRLLAIRYDGSGDVTKSHIVWQMDGQMPRKPSMLLVGDELYFVADSGIGFCLDAATGEEHWKERLTGNYSASPLYADGRIYFFSQEGRTLVIQPGKEFKQVAENTLDGGFMASPAVAGHALFLRTETHLYRIENE
ncbi:PQQ-binding-like beta-propeller repeat protein [bacterium]|nr:PQQ-binding-like beta-propeller repeat protein [bacterium]